MRHQRVHLIGLLIVLLLFTACQSQEPAPPPTLEAAASTVSQLENIALNDIDVLQQRAYGSGRVLLYSWSNSGGATCLATTYLTPLNNEWEAHDTLTTGCFNEDEFTAAYTGNSLVDAPFGPPRYTTVYGLSPAGRAVRIVWSDGQVNHVPLQNSSFLEMRSGRWHVERIELLDANNDLLLAEDWLPDSSNRTN